MSCPMRNTLGKQTKTPKQNYEHLLLKEGHRVPFSSYSTQHVPSRNSGEGIEWHTVDLKGGQNGEGFFSNNFISFYFIGGGEISAVSHFLSSLSWWPSKVRSGCLSSVSFRTFDWQTAELLSTKKGLCSVPSKCKNPLRWPFPRHFGWKFVLQQAS